MPLIRIIHVLVYSYPKHHPIIWIIRDAGKRRKIQTPKSFVCRGVPLSFSTILGGLSGQWGTITLSFTHHSSIIYPPLPSPLPIDLSGDRPPFGSSQLLDGRNQRNQLRAHRLLPSKKVGPITRQRCFEGFNQHCPFRNNKQGKVSKNRVSSKILKNHWF